MSRRSSRLALPVLDSEHRLQILQQYNYANVAYIPLPYNMASATLNIETWGHNDRNDVIVILYINGRCVGYWCNRHCRRTVKAHSHQARLRPSTHVDVRRHASVCIDALNLATPSTLHEYSLDHAI